tara:strand:+ start:3398 stop:11878 length:8481 start_codon:yes stop_codon:yes gene_type:complete
MEVQKFRITRKNAPSYWSIPCSGGTDYWPINYSTNCSGVTMYNSTTSDVDLSLSGDMTTFPEELRGCSISNPCVLLNDQFTSTNINQCTNIGQYGYVKFMGLKAIFGGTFIQNGSYNELVHLTELTNSNQYSFTPNVGACFCLDPLDENLSQITLKLTQDFNDIGHYSIWDGNISQKDIFSNFIITADTNNPMKIRVYNTTDFSYYKTLQDSPYTISFGGSQQATLQYPNLSTAHTYTNSTPMQKKITITQETPWGPMSVSQTIWVPFMTYPQLKALGPVVGIPPQEYPIYNHLGTQISSGFHEISPRTPWDSGTDIMQYSALSPTSCFDVSGVTESMLNLFQTYSSTPSGSAFLPPGYFELIPTELGSDVVNPITDEMVPAMIGQITQATATYTAYTISSGVNNAASIELYDFLNGITLYNATSCGLNSLAFGAYDCFKCLLEDCTFCETKDEYTDRITGVPMSILSGPSFQKGVWSPSIDYVRGDIIFDENYGQCCCYMAVEDINQTSSPSPWAGVPPTETYQGVWYDNGLPTKHIWEACDQSCLVCPPGTTVPCEDPTIVQLAPEISLGVPLLGGVYVNGDGYTTGQFVSGLDGNCYQALVTGNLGSPSAFTNSNEWDYIGCGSWICPQDLINVSTTSCDFINSSALTVTTPQGPFTLNGYPFYGDCIDDYNDGECYPDRWLCGDELGNITQYSCNGCIEITTNNPAYTNFDPANPYAGPVFQNEPDCMEWCEPPAWSCTTSTGPGGECCSLISCDEDFLTGTPVYTSLITNVINSLPSTIPPPFSEAEYIANVHQLYFTNGPWTLYGGPKLACNNGVPLISDVCCDYTGWNYDCEQGCYETTLGGNYPTQYSCQTDNPAGITQCGWSCETINSPCIPCYTLGCGWPMPNEDLCNQNCTALTTCIVCDCTSQTPCSMYADPNNNGQPGCPYWPPDPLGFPPTFTSYTQCDEYCECDVGWDCVLNDDGTPTSEGCTQYPSAYVMAQLGVIFSQPPPFTGYATSGECCEATRCCHADCNDDFPPGTGTTQMFPTGYYPCAWFLPIGSVDNCSHGGPLVPGYNSNYGLPYCDIIECTMDLCVVPNITPDEYECCPDADSCACACNWLEPDPGNPVFTDKGYYDPGLLYGEGDIVSYWDPNSPGTIDNPCCYLCACPWLGIGTAGTDPFGTGIVYDCTIFYPDDGPATDGTPNCWLSCDHTAGGAVPSPICGEPCGPCCGGASGDTFECTPDGCIISSCVIDVNFSETSQNCYSGLGNCDGECGASCFCSENLSTGVDETGCVSQYDWLTQTDTILQISTATVSYPNYPPLVPAGLFAPTFPLATLNDCLAIADPTGFLDCCDTTGTTYNCDDSSNCEPMSNTAGLGCIPIPPGHGSYPGQFTSMVACQEWCTWTCNTDPLSFAGCSCVFLSNPSSPPVPTYVSAFDCWMHTNNCDCCAATTYFCDQHGAINGLYGTPGVSACVSESYINGQSVSVQSQAWGVGQISYFNGGTGFASLQDCEDQCVFCCQCTPPGGGFCELEWGQTLCCTGAAPQLNPSDCQITTVSTIGYYPCSGASTEYYCDELDGCTGYLTTNPPATFASGPYFDMISCQAECNFLCGDCVNGCVCVFLNQTTTCSPVFDSMTGCTFSVNSGPYTNSPTDNCCNCYECIQIGSVNYYTWDVGNSSWVLSNTPISLPPTPSTLGSTWINTTQYQLGDVVIFTQTFGAPSYSSTTCCYVCVTDSYTQPTHGALTPFDWYEAYWNDYQTNTPVWENGGGTGNLIWIPCDTGCIGPVNVVTWNCIEGTETNSCDGFIFLDGATDPTLPWAGGLIPDFTTYMQYIAITANGLQSTPHSGMRVETNGNSPCVTSYGGMWMSVGLKIKSCNDDPIADAAIPGGGLSTTSYADFVNQATTLGILGLSLSNTHPENWAAYQTHCGQSNNESSNWTAWASTYGVSNTLITGGYDYADPNYCTCTTSPCYCNSVIGNGGQYNTEQDCQDVIDSFGPGAHPCCESATTGYYVCDVGAVCSCIFDPAALSGYPDQLTCENDVTTCCHIPIPWECVQSFTPSNYTDSCVTTPIMDSNESQNLVNIGWDMIYITNEMAYYNLAYPTNVWGYETVIASYGINADFSNFKWAKWQLECPPALQGTTCCRHPNNDYQYVKGNGMNNLILDAIAGSVQTFYTLKDYIDTAVALGAPANQLNSGLNPSAYGVFQGYQCDYGTIAHIIGNSLGSTASMPNGCYSEVGGALSFVNCDRFNVESCCVSDCTCVQNSAAVAPNSFIDSISCENDPNFCCYSQPIPKWECFDWGDNECECLPSATGIYDNKLDCENDYPNNCCSLPPPPGAFVCDGNCNCVWDPTATIGFPNLPSCQASQTTCCFVPPAGFWVCDIGAVCSCIFDATALSGYLNIGDCQTDLNSCCGPETYYRCFDWGDDECECLVDATCFAPGGGCYANITLCQNDYGQNCCSPIIVTPSWDCYNGVCSDPGTGLGQYGSYAMCVAICSPPITGCEDCDSALAQYLTGPTVFTGTYNSITNYPINNCLVDPYNDCCYCCVNWGIIPNISNNDGSDHPNESSAKMSAPPRCAMGNQPSLTLGQNIGGGMWMECGFDNDGNECGDNGDCGKCAITLANDLTGPITYKPWINNSNYYSNDCLVKPSGQNCCYCCVPQSNKSNALPEISNIPCNVTGNQLVANFGFQWKNCGVDVDGEDCTGLPDTCVKCCKDSNGYVTQLTLNHPTCECPVGEVEVNCRTSNDPCRDMPASSCCGKCGPGNAGSVPGNSCYDFCQQWGSCCGVGPDDPHDDDGPVELIEAPCIQTESCAIGYQWSWGKCKCVVSRINLTER